MDFKKGVAYFTISDKHMMRILKYAKKENLKIGKDIGLLSYNDTEVKKFIANGITVVSCDFKKIGLLTAKTIKEDTIIKSVVPTRAILRNSL